MNLAGTKRVFLVVTFALLVGLLYGQSDGSSSTEGNARVNEASMSAIEQRAEKKVNVDFIFGGSNFTYYPRKRLARFYADYFGFLNLPIWGIVDIPIPAGLTGIGIQITGIDINGSPTTVKIPFGGGVRVMRYDRGADGNWAEFSQGDFGGWWEEHFWTIQEQRSTEGKEYVERDYDVAFAQWGLEWTQHVLAPKSPGSDVSFFFAYSGSFQYWLQDNNPFSRQLLFETDFPDKEMSILHKFIAAINYSYTDTPKQRFTHGLSDNIYCSFRFEIAPGVMNPNLYGAKSQRKNRRGKPYFYYQDSGRLTPLEQRRWRRTTDLAESEADFGVGGMPFMELTPTADYYYTGVKFGGKKALWDVAPNLMNNVFSGEISADCYLDWTSQLGWDGYIPLVVRSGQPRFKTGANINLKMVLPEITILDLKSWSTPRANLNWAKAENAVFGALNKLGIGYSREQFNTLALIKPRIETGFNASYWRDYDGNFKNFWAERDYQYKHDKREGFAMDYYADLIVNVIGLLDIRLGFRVNFKDMDIWFAHVP